MQYQVLAGVQCVCNFVVFILGILIINGAYKASQHTSRDLVSVTQITEDWEQLPFVEIEIKDQPCENFGMHSVFERVWRGTAEGCYENTGSRFFNTVDHVYEYNDWD